MEIATAGAFAFGLIIGWYIYYVNRYRKADVQLGDITTIIGAIGGGAVIKLFGGSDAIFAASLFGAYGIGLAVGFFGYFAALIILVGGSNNFDRDWFLDGRRRSPGPGWGYGEDARATMAPMDIGIAPHAIGAPVATRQPLSAQPAAAALGPPLGPAAERVIHTCRALWAADRNACNFFVVAVADRLGVALGGTADEIVDEIRSADWRRLADGRAAQEAASAGKFVIAGMKSSEFSRLQSDGHVAIVVDGAMNAGGWAPAGYWDSTDAAIAAKGGAGHPISLCFRSEDADRIIYAWHPT